MGDIGWKLDVIGTILGGVAVLLWIIHKQLAEIIKELKRRADAGE